MTIRTRTLTILATLCAVMGVLGMVSVPALASATHVFSKAFGEPCSTTPCGPGQLDEPDGVAVNEATGDVYVVDKGDNRVEYYSATGVYEGQFDGSGTIEIKGKVESGTPAPTGQFSSPENIAIDNDPLSPSYGDAYVTDEGHGVIDKFSSTGMYINQLSEGTPGEPLSGQVGIAIGPSGELWVVDFGGVSPDTYDFSSALANAYISTRANLSPGGGSDGATAPSLAVDSSENYYVEVDGGGNDLAEFNASGELIQNEIEAGEPASDIAVELSSGGVYVDNVDSVAKFSSQGTLTERFGSAQLKNGSGLAINSSTFDLYVADSSADTIDEYPSVASTPSVSNETFSNVTAHRATVGAQVNTDGLDTTYAIEYGTSETYGSTTEGTELQGSFQGSVPVSTNLQAVLLPETTYHFRVTAKNNDGTVYGPDESFTTLSGFTGLPDGRGYELVSPVANADGNVYVVGGNVVCGDCTALPMRASADGSAVEYVADPLATGGNGSVGAEFGNEFVATRGANGWSTVDLETLGLNKTPFEALFSDELVNSGAGSVPAGAHSLNKNEEGLFDSVGGREIPVSVLPPVHAGETGERVRNATFGGPPLAADHLEGEEGPDYSHVISADGSRVFWTDLEEGPYEDHVFVRENNDVTVPVSVGAARFWTASTDGRYVFYTEDATETLWRFDVENESREELAGESAGVQGVIGTNETGEDGAYVYFVAKGALAPGATPGDCELQIQRESYAGVCNMYVLHDGVTSFITKLSAKDIAIYFQRGHELESAGDWLAGLKDRTAEVAADGEAIVFTEGDLYVDTGEYDASTEVYVYEADTGRLSCVSCNPSGGPGGQGSLPRSLNGYSRIEETISNPGTFLHRWVSADGSRVFFESGEPLVAADTDGSVDVYEWERDGSGTCTNVKGCVYLLSGGSGPDSSYLLDASASGDDVFIISRARLTSQDQGETYEVYDARVGAAQPPAPPSCTGTGCQGLPAGPPLFATPSSETFNGVGNFSGSTAVAGKTKSVSRSIKCKKGSVRKKGRCVKAKTGKRKVKKSTHGKGSK